MQLVACSCLSLTTLNIHKTKYVKLQNIFKFCFLLIKTWKEMKKETLKKRKETLKK